MKNPVEYVIELMHPVDAGGRTGVAVLAEVAGVHRVTVGRWRHTGLIPSEHFSAIIDWGKRNRVEVSLKRLVQARRVRV